MRKALYYILVVVGLAVLCTGCTEEVEAPTIDPPVNELLDNKHFKEISNIHLEVYQYEAKYIRKAQEQIEFDTIQ